MKRSNLKIFILLALLSASILGCGAEGGEGANGGASANGENPLSPGNLPPPGSDASSADLSALANHSNLFFQRKELWDSFSDELKAKVWESYSKSGSLVGAGPGGHGYYNTLFGRVSPRKAGGASLPKVEFLKGDHAMYLMDQIGMPGQGVQYCDSICIDSPLDKLKTVYDSVIISGRINLSKSAVFSPSDPIMMVSVFKQNGEAVTEEMPIYPSDVSSTPVSPPTAGGGSEAQPAPEVKEEDIGSFGKTVPLMGPGEYTVVLSFFLNNDGEVSAQPVYITIYRQDIPNIELLTLTPPPTGNQNVPDPAHRNDPLKKIGEDLKGEYQAGMLGVNAVVKVSTASNSIDALKENVGILFQNYDISGKLRYSSSGNESFNSVSAFVPELPEDQSPAKKAELPLFGGYNKIVITSHNQQLDDFYTSMGLNPPPSQKIEFNIQNTLPSVNIKMLNPANGSLVEPTGAAGEDMQISFCMTDLPNYPGRTPPAQSGECIPNWNGEKPTVIFNNYEYGKTPAAPLSYDATTGIYSFRAKPMLGANILNISIANKSYLPDWTDNTNPEKPITVSTNLGEAQVSFNYGKVNKLIENGKLKESDNFLSRGMSLEINKQVISTDLKKILAKYLNQDSFKQSLRDIFSKKDSGPPVVCTETGSLSISDGDTSIDFLPEGFDIGNIEVNQIEPKSDGRLYLDVTIQGFHGEANLRGFNAPVQIQIGGKDASFVPLSVWVKELRARIALRLGKENGLMKVMIERQAAGEKAVTLVGDGPLGNVAHVNSTRNPLAAGLEAYDAQTGLLSKSFGESLESTILCGVEAGLNHKENGLPKWDADLFKLVAYNNLNPFRIPLEFELLNNLVGLDIAYDLLRSSIQFNSQGITIKNIPLRFTPSPRALGNLAVQYASGVLGSLSLPNQSPELEASLPKTGEAKNVSMSLSEDAVNQALFAATAAGMLNLDIDPNFYSNHQINFISLALPTVDGMFPNKKVDFNQNGVQDDENLPVLLRIKGDPANAPVLHFLTKQEVDELADKVNANLGADNGTLNKDLHIFRLSVSNLELAFYLVQPYSKAQGGYKEYCTSSDSGTFVDSETTRSPVDPILITGKSEPTLACSQKLSLTYENTQGTCGKGYQPFTAPVKNGPIVSAVPGSEEVPVVRMKANLVLYGVVQGVYREVMSADKWELDPADSANAVAKPDPKPSTFARLKLLTYAPADPLIQIRVTENYSSFSEKQLTSYLVDTILKSALGKECEFFNEIRIPIPDSLLKDKSSMSQGFKDLLDNLGLDSISLGTLEGLIPELPYHRNAPAGEDGASNPLYLDLKAHLGLCYKGEACN